MPPPWPLKKMHMLAVAAAENTTPRCNALQTATTGAYAKISHSAAYFRIKNLTATINSTASMSLRTAPAICTINMTAKIRIRR